MNVTAIKNLMTATLSAFGAQVLIVLSATLGIAIAYYLFKFSWRLIQGTTVTNWAWLDRHTYKPWKGYNRLMSKNWNLRKIEFVNEQHKNDFKKEYLTR
jgi:hypothetical protein